MADIKDKVVTVESLSALHESNKETYMTKENPVCSGSFSMNRMPDTTIGDDSHAEGHRTIASSYYSHAEGYQTTAEEHSSHAEGYETTASGSHSHAEGRGVVASGNSSHAEGYETTASGDYSHAEGNSTTASEYAAHSEGFGTIASSDYQHVQGKYNIEDTSGKYAHIVGNGTGDDFERSNAHTLDWDGNAWFAGNVSMDGNIILNSQQYGNTLPSAGTKGRIFFKKLTE